MRIVVDTNILFSFFWKESLTKKLIDNPSFNLVSPETALLELKKYKEEIKNKTKINEKDFNFLFVQLKQQINFINKKDYDKNIKAAEEISPDKADSDFIALSLKYNCPLWSNDAILKKQDKIAVISTKELIELLPLD